MEHQAKSLWKRLSNLSFNQLDLRSTFNLIIEAGLSVDLTYFKIRRIFYARKENRWC